MFGNHYHISINLQYPVRGLSKTSANVLSGVICNGIVMAGKMMATVTIYNDHIDFGSYGDGRDGQVFFNYYRVNGRLIYRLDHYCLSSHGVLEYKFGGVSEPDDPTVYELLRNHIL